MELVGIYADEGVSAAKSLDKRTGLLRLLADADQHKFSVFLFKDLTRFSRNAAQYYKVAERLEKACRDTLADGIMTKDLALLSDRAESSVLTEDFISAVAERL